jgi:hypothetical protein
LVQIDRDGPVCLGAESLYRVSEAANFLGENPTLSWGNAGGSPNRMKYTNTLQGGDLTPYYQAGMTDRDPAVGGQRFRRSTEASICRQCGRAGAPQSKGQSCQETT